MRANIPLIIDISTIKQAKKHIFLFFLRFYAFSRPNIAYFSLYLQTISYMEQTK